MEHIMNKSKVLSVLLAVLVLLSGCGGGSGAGGNQPPAPAPAPAPASEAPQPAPEAQQPEASAWDKLVAAAKEEGKLTISAPPGELWRQSLTRFQEAYPEITLEYTGQDSRDFWPKVTQERELGQYLWDMRIGGPDPTVWNSKNAGHLAPVKPLLILPEVSDESKWFGGFDGLFTDNEKQYVPSFLAFARSTTFVNRDMLSESELESDEQLLDPAFKGKIVLQDPRGGAGLGMLAILLGAYGEEFVTKLLTEQEVVVTSDGRQMAEWIVRGRYPIALGLNPDQLAYFSQQGLDVSKVKPLKRGSVGLTVGFGAIQYLDKAPHPNASQLFINWLLSKDTQTQLTQLQKTNSRRTDVEHFNPAEVIKEDLLSTYFNHQDESYNKTRTRASQLASELIK